MCLLASSIACASRALLYPESEERDAAHAVMMKELARNGYDHVRIDEAQLSGGNVREEDIQAYFGGLKVDKVRNE